MMARASNHRAASRRNTHALTTPRATCTAAEGLDAENFCGPQLAGELFLLTSSFIEPKGYKFEFCLVSHTFPLRLPPPLR